MSPLQFEQSYRSDWEQLEDILATLRGGKRRKAIDAKPDGEQFSHLYRRACEHLALARARSYPVHMIQRLELMTSDAHQAIYQRREFGLWRLTSIFTRDFPRAVRQHARYVWLAAALFLIPTLVMGVIVYQRPELILSIVDAPTAANYDEMYNQSASIGRTRTADTDWMMFGHYIRNNIGVAFQCYAAGLFAGIGSIFFVVFNGVLAGGVGGYLTERGMGDTFYSFVVTHAAFELTAIVLSGAAGLRIGHSLLAPGRRKRIDALVAAASDSVMIVYGVIAMLVIAAAIEAFWSSARWLPNEVKYGVAALCWTAVISYFCLQGRGRAPGETSTDPMEAHEDRREN